MLTHQTGQQTVPPGLTAQRCRPRGESARPTACSLAGPSKTLPRAHPGCPKLMHLIRDWIVRVLQPKAHMSATEQSIATEYRRAD